MTRAAVTENYLQHLQTNQIWEFNSAVAFYTLMTGTLGLNLEESWLRTSARSCWCFSIFLIFMMRTMAAYRSTRIQYLLVHTSVKNMNRQTRNCWWRGGKQHLGRMQCEHLPVLRAFCLPQCFCELFLALVSAPSSLAHWCLLAAFYWTNGIK